MVALIALVAPQAATAAPSPEAYARAAKFVASKCSHEDGPSYDPAAIDALAAVFQRTLNRQPRNGRIQIMPIQLYAASAELVTLAWHCRRQHGVQRVRLIEARAGGQSPDIQIERTGQLLGVEVTSVTGRYPRAWQYRASTRVDPLTGEVKNLQIGSRAPTQEDIEKAIGRKISGGQLSAPASPDGGIIELHVAARGTSAWATIADAVRTNVPGLTTAPHVRRS